MPSPRPLLLALFAAACGADPARDERVPDGPGPAAPAPGESAAEPAPGAGPMDLHPARRTASPSGRFEARVGEDRRLVLHGQEWEGQGGQREVDAPVDPRVAFSPDESVLVYARDGGLGETDLWRVALPDGDPEPVVQWRGTEDRPVLSPDGRRVAFVSGATGIASWWVVDLTGALPVPMEQARQLTNVDLVKVPGRAPDGWVPAPTTTPATWDAQGLSWVAQGQRHTVAVPQ